MTQYSRTTETRTDQSIKREQYLGHIFNKASSTYMRCDVCMDKPSVYTEPLRVMTEDGWYVAAFCRICSALVIKSPDSPLWPAMPMRKFNELRKAFFEKRAVNTLEYGD